MKKTLLVLGAKLAVTAALGWWVLSSLDLGKLGAEFARVSAPLFWACVALYTVSNLTGAWQWRIFLRGARISLPYRRVLVYYFTGMFFNNFLLSSVGGDAVRLFDVARAEKQRGSRVLATIMVDRIFGLVCLILLGNAAFFLVGFSHGLVVWAYMLFDVGIVFLFVFLYSNGLRYRFFRLARRLPWHRVRLMTIHFLQALSAYRKHGGLFLRALPWGLGTQALRIAVGWLIALAFGREVALVLFFVFIPVLGIVKVLPLTVMGLGMHEAVGAKLFGIAGLPAAETVSFLLLFQLCVMLTNLVGGVFLFVRRGTPAAPHTDDARAA